MRLKLSGCWHHGHATVQGYDELIVRRFNAYARRGPETLGIDPARARIELDTMPGPRRGDPSASIDQQEFRSRGCI